MKKKLLRALSAIFAASMVLSCAVSCGKTEDPAAEATSASETEATTAATEPAIEPGVPFKLEGEPIELTEEFVLLCADNQNDAILMLVNNLKTQIRKKTGIMLSMGYINSPKEKEIILGHAVGRNGCDEAYETIGEDDYVVYTEGSTVVLGAWTKDNLTEAVNMFVEHALVQDGDRWLIYPHVVKEENSVPMGLDLSAYRIVYSENAGSYLKNTVVPHLQNNIKTTFGVDVPAVSDKEAPTECEIVLGDTNRNTATIQSYFDDGKKLTAYGHAIVPDGSRIYVLSKSEFALYGATTTLCEQATPEIGPDIFCVRADPWFSPAPNTKDVAELAEGADIRIMSYNILHPSWGNVAVEGRDKNVANILMYYMPDVVGIQETSSGWHIALQKLMVDSGMYAFACQKNNAHAYNMTTFMYNTQTVKLIDEYVIDLDKDSEIRVFSVAVFEKLSDGKRFVVTNTHPAPTSQAENYKRNFASLLGMVAAELDKYKDLPLIMTGDFNTSEQASMYATFKNTAGVKDAKYEADVMVRSCDTCPGLNASPKMGNSGCIDHIFVNANTDVKLFNMVIDHNASKTSDHIPIYADIAFK